MIIVLSMHRSGSSLLAGMLHDNGFYAGAEGDLIPPNKHNQKGYYERRDVVQFNESLIAQQGFNSSLPDVDSKIQPSAEKLRELQILVDSLRTEGVRIIKDPRLCLTLSLWLPLLDNVKVVFLFRSPLDVAESYVRRQRYPYHGALALWEFYNLSALSQISNVDYASVEFSSLMADPEAALLRLNDELDLGLDSSKINVSRSDHDLVHGASGSRNIGNLTESQSKLFRELSQGHKPHEIVFPSSMYSVMRLMGDFMHSGYEPSTGCMLDDASAQKMSEVVSRNREFREQVKHLKRVVVKGEKSLAGAQVKVANAQAKVAELESNQVVLDQRLQYLSKQEELLNKLLVTHKRAARTWAYRLVSKLLLMLAVVKKGRATTDLFYMLENVVDKEEK